MITVKALGLTEASRRLAALSDKVERSILRKGLRQGCKPVLADARSNAPQRTGALSRNIKIRSGRSAKGRISMTVGVNQRDFQGEAFYASFVLYGWHHGARKLGDKRKYIEPNNFLERAYDDTKDEAADTTVQTWLELIEGQA